MPDKKENSPSSTIGTRRSFFSKLWILLGVVAFIEFIGVAGAFLLPWKKREKSRKLETVIECGPVEKFPREFVTAFIRGRFYLSRLADGGFIALSAKCTHLGCTVPWISGEKKFACPCHASAFDIRGEVISPPAPRPLDIHPVFIENNIIKVDTGKLLKRSQFFSDQVTYPKTA